jgi:hypothetical protein
MTNAHRLTAAQYEAVRLAAARLSRALEPLPSYIRGAARQSVRTALVASGYVSKCYFPGHVEYVLTDLGLACLAGVDAAAVQRASGETSATAPDSAVSPAQHG